MTMNPRSTTIADTYSTGSCHHSPDSIECTNSHLPPKKDTTTIDMTGYCLEDGNDDKAEAEMPVSLQRQPKAQKHSQHHDGYDFEQRQQQQQQLTNTIQGTSMNTLTRTPPSKSPLAFPPVAVVSISASGPLTTGQLQQQYRQQKLLQRQQQQQHKGEEQEDMRESGMEKLDLLRKDRRAHYHHRAVIMGDSAVHLNGEEGLGSTAPASPSSSLLSTSPAAATGGIHHDTLSSALQQLVGNDSVHGGHAHGYGNSENVSTTAVAMKDNNNDGGSGSSGDDADHSQQQPLSRKSVANIQSEAPLPPSLSPPSPVSISNSGNGEGGGECGKTTWEGEDTGPETPALQHQHGTSLFDFLRGRKPSIPNNCSNYHQAAAPYARDDSGTSLMGPTATPTGIAATPSSAASTPAATHPKLLPPPIYKSRLSGAVMAPGRTGPPVPPPVRKQSLDTSMLQGSHFRNSGHGPPLCSPSNPGIPTGGSSWSARRDSIHQTMHISTQTPQHPQPQHPIASAAQSTFSKVAAAVIGATVGKRRPSVSVASEIETGAVGIASPQLDGDFKQQPQQQPQGNHGGSSHMRYGPPLDQEQLNNHAWFMKPEKSMSELKEYVERLYHTVLSRDVAMEHSMRRISALQRELEQTRVRAEEDKKALVGEIDRVKEQAMTMEENFLLWRTKVHNDQMAQHEEYLHERLVKQDRVLIEELVENLSASQEEATRLRNRLLVLEYEDDYIGPSSLFMESDVQTNHFSIEEDDNSSNPSTAVTIEYGPMSVAAHKRRSGDFKILEQRARSFEAQVQGLKKTVEQEREDHQKALVEFRMRLHDKCVRLEQEVQAAKMESTMYTEMMHEIVSENDDLRKQVKEARRKLRRQGSTSFSSRSEDIGGRRTKDCFGYGSEDEMEEIAI